MPGKINPISSSGKVTERPPSKFPPANEYMATEVSVDSRSIARNENTAPCAAAILIIA